MPRNILMTILLLVLTSVASTTHHSYTIDDFVDGEVDNDVLSLQTSDDKNDVLNPRESDNDDNDFGNDDSERFYERQRTR
jgi:hypothetical protein